MSKSPRLDAIPLGKGSRSSMAILVDEGRPISDTGSHASVRLRRSAALGQSRLQSVGDVPNQIFGAVYEWQDINQETVYA